MSLLQEKSGEREEKRERVRREIVRESHERYVWQELAVGSGAGSGASRRCRRADK